jgi:hypothetical protein
MALKPGSDGGYGWSYCEPGYPKHIRIRVYPSGRKELVDFSIDPPRVVSVLDREGRKFNADTEKDRINDSDLSSNS